MARRIPAIKRGFTLAESLMASVVLAITVVGVGGAMSAGFGQTAAMQEQTTSVMLARQLMEEIASKPFIDSDTGTIVSGPQAGENSRASYNSIGDYNGYSDSTANLKNLGGQTVAIGNGLTYTRNVSVEYRQTPSGTASGTGNFALITVTVSNPKGQAVKLQRMVTNIVQGF